MKWQKDQEKKGRPRDGCGVLAVLLCAGIGGCVLILLAFVSCVEGAGGYDEPEQPILLLTAAVLAGSGAILIALVAILHMLLDIAWRQWRTHERPPPKPPKTRRQKQMNSAENQGNDGIPPPPP